MLLYQKVKQVILTYNFNLRKLQMNSKTMYDVNAFRISKNFQLRTHEPFSPSRLILPENLI